MADWEEGYKDEIPLMTEWSKNVHREDTRPFLRMNMAQLLKLEKLVDPSTQAAAQQQNLEVCARLLAASRARTVHMMCARELAPACCFARAHTTLV